MEDDFIYLLKLLSNDSNWEYDSAWGPYGRIFESVWVGDEDLKKLSDEFLEKYGYDFE